MERQDRINFLKKLAAVITRPKGKVVQFEQKAQVFSKNQVLARLKEIFNIIKRYPPEKKHGWKTRNRKPNAENVLARIIQNPNDPKAAVRAGWTRFPTTGNWHEDKAWAILDVASNFKGLVDKTEFKNCLTYF